jgi:integrin alpha 8
LDDVCTYDLVLTHVNTTYLGLDGSQFSNQMNLSVGAINRILIFLDYRNNLIEEAFNSFIRFTLPTQYLHQAQVLPLSQFISCNITNPHNGTHSTYECPVKSQLSSSDGTNQIYLSMVVRNITGNEGTLAIPISVGSPSTTFSAESNINDNGVLVSIPVYASATYTVSWVGSNPSYTGISSNFNNKDANTLGQEVVLSADIHNSGPAIIREAEFDIYIPSYSNETGQYYYFYPTAISVVPASSCDDGNLNPQGYNVSSPSSQRKRRSVHMPNREKRQSDVTDNGISIVEGTDCSVNQFGCINVKCNVTNLVRTARVRITGYIDERFFNGKNASYILRSLIVVNIVSDDVTDVTTVSNTAIVSYIMLPFTECTFL